MRIKAVAFDAYGTLFDVHTVVEKCEQLFPGKGNEFSEVWRTKQIEYTWLRSLMGRYKNFWEITRDALVFTLKDFNVEWDEDVVTTLMNEYLSLNPFAEVPQALETLKNKVDLTILSNGSPDMLTNLVTNANLDHVFRKLISVDELKIFKPFMGVYQLGPANLDMTKEEILFISSNPWDVSGAKTFGYQVCWIDRYNKQFEELDVHPDMTIKGLDELVDKL